MDEGLKEIALRDAARALDAGDYEAAGEIVAALVREVWRERGVELGA